MEKLKLEDIKEFCEVNHFFKRDFANLNKDGLKFLTYIIENFPSDNSQDFNQWICNGGRNYDATLKQGINAEVIFVNYLDHKSRQRRRK